MRSAAILLLVLTGLGACATHPEAVPVVAGAGLRQVSVNALLGRAGEFDGQPVRVLGVVGFKSGTDGRSAIYDTADDARRSTDRYIELGSIAPGSAATADALEALRGKPVAVEGIFHAKPLNRLPQRPGTVVACVGECRTSGVVEDITRVYAQEP